MSIRRVQIGFVRTLLIWDIETKQIPERAQVEGTQDLSVEGIPPERFDTTQLGGDTLVLGAPYIGKSELASETANRTAAHLTDADDNEGLAVEVETHVIDEFYTVYQAAGVEEREAFEEHLASEMTTVCIFARPRAFDWLLDAEDVPLSDAVLEAFDRVVNLQYDPDETDGDREAATMVAKRLGIDEDGDGDGLDESKLHAHLDDLAYQYEYRNERLSSSLGAYEKTLVPTLVAYISIQAGEEGLLSPGVGEVCHDLAANFSISQFIESAKDVATDVVTPETVGMVGASVAGPAFAAAASFGMWMFFREGSVRGDDAQEPDLAESLAVLAGDDLTPTARAEFEARLDLPPRTLNHLSELLAGDSLRRLRELCENAPERMDEFEQRVEAHEAELVELWSTVERLEDEVGSLEAFYSKQLAEAAHTLDDIAEQIEADEAALLKPEVDQEDVDADAIPWVDPRASPENDNPSDTQKLNSKHNNTNHPTIELITESATDGRLVVLKGGHGTGKTTAAYRAGCRLEEQGYTVRVPGLDGPSVPFIEEKLARDSGDEPLALVVSFDSVLAGTHINPGHLFVLFGWLDEGVCDTVILECRSELYLKLKDSASNIDRHYGVEPWENHKSVPLHRFDNEKRLIRIVLWVAKLVGNEKSVPNDEEEFVKMLWEILSISSGNSEVTKIAAKIAFREGSSLDEFETEDGLVRKDIGTLFDNTGADSVEMEQIFRYLAVASELETEELSDLLDIETWNLRPFAKDLQDYLGAEIRSALRKDEDLSSKRWQLSPDVYADVTFRRCLSVEKDEGARAEFTRLFRDMQSSVRHSEFVPKVAANLSVAYSAAKTKAAEQSEERPIDPQQLEEWTVDAADWFLDEMATDQTEAETLFRCVRNLAFGGVPVDVTPITDKRKKLFNGAYVESKDHEVERGTVLQNILGRLLAAQSGGHRNMEQVTGLANSLASEVYKIDEDDPAQFLANVYSIALSHLANGHTPREVEAWVDDLAARADTAAVKGPHDTSPAKFLTNVYSMAISQLTNSHTPREVEAWVDDLTARADTAAAKGPHADDPAQFLTNVYIMTFKKLVDSHTPEEAEAWVDDLATRLPKIVGRNPFSRAPSVSIAGIGAKTLTDMSTSRTAGQTEDWHRLLLGRIAASISEDSATVFYDEFLRIYFTFCSQDDVLPAALPILVEDVLGRTGRFNEPIFSSEEERVNLAASVVSDAVFALATLLDKGLDHHISTETLVVLGTIGSDDIQFLTEIVSSVDDRIASSDTPDWLREGPGDDDVVGIQCLRDRFVGRTYAVAHRAIEADEETDLSPDSVFEEANFHGRASATIRLYRSGLQAVLDNAGTVVGPIFHGVWTQRKTVSDVARPAALAAGVGYAAYLELWDESATEEQGEILNAVEQHRDELAESAKTLLDVLLVDEREVDIKDVFAGVNIDAGDHDLSDLEALAYGQFVWSITDLLDSSDYYQYGLEQVIDNEPNDALAALKEAWIIPDSSI